jgi:3-hydroxybutyryl-CoA dehydrogenase
MQQISVIGSGTMGNGIAHVFAMHGYQVALIDVAATALPKAIATITANCDRMVAKNTITPAQKQTTLDNITTHTDLQQGVQNADLVIEAATENEGIKLNIFKNLESLTKPTCILASNTSSISITKIAAATSRPAQVIGMHFMNPVPLMQLVEIINGYKTSAQTTAAIVELSQKINKIPVTAHDYPGFVANRILMPMINEAIYTLHEGVAGIAQIDTVMKLGMAHPMGPLQLADFIGLDVCLAILNVLHAGFGNPKYAPCPLLVNMVTAGNLGIKSGIGFYNYENGTKNAVPITNLLK